MNKPIKARLLGKRMIDKDGCWLWTGLKVSKKKEHAYGRIGYLGKHYLVHRVAAHIWLEFALDSPLNVLHKCDKPSCFRPRCLFEGTHLRNMKDAVQKGRHWSVKEASKKFCKLGHEFSGRNLVYTGKQRQCRTCCVERTRKWRRKQREFCGSLRIKRDSL